MNELKRVRWIQRLQNLEKAFLQLERGVKLETPNDIEIQGIIQCFEFTFELSWKTLKDYLESQGVEAPFPREVIKQSFQAGILKNGEMWLEMLSKRNMLAHTYDEELALKAYELITNDFYHEIAKLLNWFLQQKDENL